MVFCDLAPFEDMMGWFMLMIGCLRIRGLMINGARSNAHHRSGNSWQGRLSHMLRNFVWLRIL
jgi:hypothetical protein